VRHPDGDLQAERFARNIVKIIFLLKKDTFIRGSVRGIRYPHKNKKESKGISPKKSICKSAYFMISVMCRS
jgi:hypothetical protein